MIAAAPVPDDECMILAHEAYVVTFDAGTVVIDGDRRRARAHIYLPVPDTEGFLSFDASELIECKAAAYRYTDAVGRKPNADGVDEVVMSDASLLVLRGQPRMRSGKLGIVASQAKRRAMRRELAAMLSQAVVAQLDRIGCDPQSPGKRGVLGIPTAVIGSSLPMFGCKLDRQG